MELLFSLLHLMPPMLMAEVDILAYKLKPFVTLLSADGSYELWLKSGIITYYPDGCVEMTYDKIVGETAEWIALVHKYNPTYVKWETFAEVSVCNCP